MKVNHPTAYLSTEKYAELKNKYLKEVYDTDEEVSMLARWVSDDLGFSAKYAPTVKDCTLAIIHDLLGEGLMSIYYFTDDIKENNKNNNKFSDDISEGALYKRAEMWRQEHADALFPKVSPEHAVNKIAESWERIYGEQMPSIPESLAWFRITDLGEKYLYENKLIEEIGQWTWGSSRETGEEYLRNNKLI